MSAANLGRNDDGDGPSQGNMRTVSRHVFGDESDEPAFTISIIEVGTLIFDEIRCRNFYF